MYLSRAKSSFPYPVFYFTLCFLAFKFLSPITLLFQPFSSFVDSFYSTLYCLTFFFSFSLLLSFSPFILLFLVLLSSYLLNSSCSFRHFLILFHSCYTLSSLTLQLSTTFILLFLVLLSSYLLLSSCSF